MTTATELAKPEEKKSPIPLDGGLVKCSNISEAYRYAQYIVTSGLAPRCFDTAEKVLIATQMGAELGLKPMQALQAIAVIQNRPALWGKGLPGVVLSKGVMEKFDEWYEGEGDNMTAICKVKRRGIENERICRFSVADAKKAGLWGKNTWATYPRDMMMYKARARAFTLFADVLCGLPVYEDLQGHEAAPRLPESPAQKIDDPLLKQVAGTIVAEVEREPGDESEDLFVSDEHIPAE